MESKAVTMTVALLSNSKYQMQQVSRRTLGKSGKRIPWLHRKCELPSTHALTGTLQISQGVRLGGSGGRGGCGDAGRMSKAGLGVASRSLGALHFPSFSLKHQLAEPIPFSQGLAL